jgi:lipoprotein NlpI
MPKTLTLLIVSWVCCRAPAGAEPPADPNRQLQAALAEARWRDALALADQLLAREPRQAPAHLARARALAGLGRHDDAVPAYDELLKLEPRHSSAYDERGSEQFILGRIDESLADFDRHLALHPEQARAHWKRGISLYYAGRYDDGARQFEAYQTVDDNDVENAVWRFLCQARAHGLESARQSLLRVKADRRVPMQQVYELFAGTGSAAAVLEAARAAAPTPAAARGQSFYAHLYLGLYYEALGDARQAREHLALAEQHPIDHYMWDVARVHHQRLRQPPSPPRAADATNR